MEENLDKTMESVGKCKCCLGEEDLKDMWTVTTEDEEPEIYGEMLNECFGLSWDHQDDDTEFICEFCTQRLKDAANFRNQILFAQRVMPDNTGIETTVDEDGNICYEVKPVVSEEEENASLTNVKQERQEMSEVDELSEYIKREPVVEYLEVEYLDDAYGKNEANTPKKRKQTFTTDLDSCITSIQTSLMTLDEAADYFNVPKDVVTKRMRKEKTEQRKREKAEKLASQGPSTNKQTKKKRFEEFVVMKDEDDNDDVEYLEAEFLSDGDYQVPEESPKRNSLLTKENKERVYLRYTESDLKDAMNMVIRKEKSRFQAARFYNVPYKTLCTKLKNTDFSTTDAKDKENLSEKQKKLIEELKVLLTYTNITPFKSKACKYYCAYCPNNGTFYDDTNLLRSHVRTQHTTDKFSGVDAFLRPPSTNEIAKIDIHNLICIICCEHIDSWNGVFQHLSEIHKVEFDEAYKKVIPFILDKELYCVLCKTKFDSFSLLDSHMNAHYTNYVCGTCGDTFMAESRLKKHEETHTIGRYECQYCDKVFTLKKYRKKHTFNMHLGEEKFRCRYCREGFHSDYARHNHMIQMHDLEAKVYLCELCDKTFNWKPYYLKHLRLIHREKIKNHECLWCGKKFAMNYELRNHYEWHEGTSKHVCVICDKKFATNQYLQKHINKHHTETVGKE